MALMSISFWTPETTKSSDRKMRPSVYAAFMVLVSLSSKRGRSLPQKAESGDAPLATIPGHLVPYLAPLPACRFRLNQKRPVWGACQTSIAVAALHADIAAVAALQPAAIL